MDTLCDNLLERLFGYLDGAEIICSVFYINSRWRAIGYTILKHQGIIAIRNKYHNPYRPVPVSHHVASVIGDSLIVNGGECTGIDEESERYYQYTHSRFAKFNLKTWNWERSGLQFTNRRPGMYSDGQSAVEYDGSMIIYSDVCVYKVTETSCVCLSDKSPLRSYHAAVVIHDKMWVYGGTTDDCKGAACLMYFDLIDLTWHDVGPVECVSLFEVFAFVHNNKMYIYVHENEIICFDPSDRSLDRIEINFARIYGGVYHNNRFFAISCKSELGYIDCDTLTWTKLETVPVLRQGCSLNIWNNTIIMFGGKNNNRARNAEISLYPLDGLPHHDA